MSPVESLETFCFCTNISKLMIHKEYAVAKDRNEKVLLPRFSRRQRFISHTPSNQGQTSGLGTLASIGHRILHHVLPHAVDFDGTALEGELLSITIDLCNRPPPEPKAMLSADHPFNFIALRIPPMLS